MPQLKTLPLLAHWRPSGIRVIGWSALTACLLFFATHTATGASNRTHQDYPPRAGSTPIVVGLPGTPSTNHLGVLTSTEQQVAKRDALHDYFVKTLLHGHKHRFNGASAWTTASGTIGAVVKFRFAHRVRLSGIWLKASRVAYRATYKHVRALRVYVDLRQNLVMRILPK